MRLSHFAHRQNHERRLSCARSFANGLPAGPPGPTVYEGGSKAISPVRTAFEQQAPHSERRRSRQLRRRAQNLSRERRIERTEHTAGAFSVPANPMPFTVTGLVVTAIANVRGASRFLIS